MSNQNPTVFSSQFNNIGQLKLTKSNEISDPVLKYSQKKKKNNKNARVKINGKKVFINIQSFYKISKYKTPKLKNKSIYKSGNASMINKENLLDNKVYKNKSRQKNNYMEFKSMNTIQKNLHKLTDHKNILIKKRNLKGSTKKLIYSEKKRKQSSITPFIEVSNEANRLNIRKKIIKRN